ncbi:Hemin import ATP-binding protein HmuV [Thalassovita gelatinovora]|uniref:Hemin import ATP-binding protein HmuV n=1 Tax=Thalassovita gelatinovora TaxID=53501 RepID=A0A0N7LVV2_THAGE|nr:ABC transporter ATP-binding protein [Thalassovita gelatinovora]QIZ81940.1 ABC transporter ATP-binding protein [Thalassovita gelatinovora]CUH67330.1 Hemin import ATP-binding protein HmuV [Thalassovita gelatinovora]SEP76221.1 iron complex transport system ATP-binding protein [Thalassovita gelatinovora]
MSLLSLQDFGVTRRKRDILRGITLAVGQGELVGIIGPNGAGKTTLMRAALGLIDATGHSSLATLSAHERGRAVAWLPQSREIAWPVDVQSLVMLGRIPHLDSGQIPSDRDRAAVDRALQRMDLSAFRDRTVTRLSGGEQARVLIARALAQETPLLMADEPIAGLDPAHQIATMRSFTELASDGHSVVVSLHDLGLAARHCTRLIVIDKGGVVADGAPKEVLTPDLVRDTFAISAFLQDTPDGIVFQPLEVKR